MNFRGLTRPRALFMLGGVLSFLSLAGAAVAAPPVISWSTSQNVGGHTYSSNAQVVNNNNNTWSIILQSTGDAASQNMHVLTGILWQDSFTGAYGKVDAVAGPGSSLLNDDNTAASGVVAQHWGYNNNLGFGIFNQGVAASGLGGLFGASSPFSGSGSPQGVDWGLVNGFGATGIAGNQNPFIKNTGVFTFSGQVAASQFGSARFQYGSSTTEPGFDVLPPSGTPLTPEIGGIYQIMAAGLPLIGVGIARRRRRTA
ncbi:MAG: hypothetical protein QM758_22155 [Armatimonas sp.]